MTKEFAKGDKVKTKSGSTEMTVVRLVGSEKEDELVFVSMRGYEFGDVICEWVDGSERVKVDVFKRGALELVVENNFVEKADIVLDESVKLERHRLSAKTAQSF